MKTLVAILAAVGITWAAGFGLISAFGLVGIVPELFIGFVLGSLAVTLTN